MDTADSFTTTDSISSRTMRCCSAGYSACQIPAAAFVDSLSDALAWIGKTRAAEQYRALWQKTTDAQPSLLPWLAKHPLQALELADRWGRLLAVVAWMRAHPRPEVYLRQVDAPSVDSKFIEAHRGVLAELLDLALSPAAIDAAATGVAQFARRYGFLDKAVRIRFRLLDPALPSLPGCQGLPDITLDAASFATLALPVQRGFITENETNFLAFPPVRTGDDRLRLRLWVGRPGALPGCTAATCTTGATSTPTVSPSSTSCAGTGWSRSVSAMGISSSTLARWARGKLAHARCRLRCRI